MNHRTPLSWLLGLSLLAWAGSAAADVASGDGSGDGNIRKILCHLFGLAAVVGFETTFRFAGATYEPVE
jgi:hypothetical protein